MKNSLLILFFTATCVHAETLPGIDAGAKYIGQKGNSRFCPQSIRPSVRRTDGQLVVQVHGNLGMIWENDKSEQEMEPGCKMVTWQSVSSTASASIADTVSQEICNGKQWGDESERRTISFEGDRIVQDQHNLKADKDGKPVLNPALEGITCTWLKAK